MAHNAPTQGLPGPTPNRARPVRAIRSGPLTSPASPGRGHSPAAGTRCRSAPRPLTPASSGERALASPSLFLPRVLLDRSLVSLASSQGRAEERRPHPSRGPGLRQPPGRFQSQIFSGPSAPGSAGLPGVVGWRRQLAMRIGYVPQRSKAALPESVEEDSKRLVHATCARPLQRSLQLVCVKCKLHPSPYEALWKSRRPNREVALEKPTKTCWAGRENKALRHSTELSFISRER
ncbi:hypothetical protein NDU88_003948 [Pleurodeles waltl]|uniref:Uncharacterized protein n=1 Tax=Pleurodeles waltl TaxID=8319 RepID=A0AAV7LIH9_PLEWA|nr:hypothetical protein NDU88_003948 [Pleurodeles waltl]